MPHHLEQVYAHMITDTAAQTHTCTRMHTHTHRHAPHTTHTPHTRPPHTHHLAEVPGTHTNAHTTNYSAALNTTHTHMQAEWLNMPPASEHAPHYVHTLHQAHHGHIKGIDGLGVPASPNEELNTNSTRDSTSLPTVTTSYACFLCMLPHTTPNATLPAIEQLLTISLFHRTRSSLGARSCRRGTCCVYS